MGSLQRRRDGTCVMLAAEHVVGRLPLCHLAIPASFISTAHALLRWTGQRWELRDLGSRNGTFVDDQRVGVGSAVRIEAGARIVFGESSETWQLVEDGPPRVMAVALDGGECSVLRSGHLAVPSDGDPQATIFPDGEGWAMEVDDVRVALQPGQSFEVGGRQWRFDCPSGAPATGATENGLKRLAEVMLRFEVSNDEEHVRLVVEGPGATHDLGHRGCFYLAMVLLRQRLKEEDSSTPEPGWIDRERLLRMVPEYTSSSHLNVDICRLRQSLYDVGVQDAARVVDRRRGQIRFGADRAAIVLPGGALEGKR
jgi:hypothetical protein